MSLGSCWAGASFIVVSWLVYRDPLVLLLAGVMGGLLLWKHRGNMVRVVKGTESKFVLHGGRQSRAAREAAAKEPAAEAAPASQGEPAGSEESAGGEAAPSAEPQESEESDNPEEEA